MPNAVSKLERTGKLCEKCGATDYRHCPKCGSCPKDHYVDRDWDHGMVGLDGDVMCKKCGSYVRLYDVD